MFKPLQNTTRPIMCMCTHTYTHTWAAVVPLHPDVAVVLGHASLRVEKRQPDASFSTQTGIVAAALLDGLFVELIAQPVGGWRHVTDR